MSNDETIVDIVDVYADAYRIAARELSQGMYVFDAFGGRYRLTSVRTHKSGRVASTRDDGVRDVFEPDEIITVADTIGR